MTSARPARPSVPAFSTHRFGDYYLTGHLGRGGMADVYLARYMGAAGFQRTVVIKRILNVGDPEYIRMFINEAKLAADLNHPNIVQLYELGENQGEFFIAMEYVRGVDLGKLLNAMVGRKQSVPRAVTAFIAREICRALAHAHAHSDSVGVAQPIIHRDVSPGNVVIGYDGQVKLVDFGVAKAMHPRDDIAQTQAGMIKGKLGYMAPEQLDGRTTPQCDIFSTGVVLHEMLTLRRLIKADNVIEQVTKLKTMTFPPPSATNPEVGADLDAIVRKALERNLGIRYATAAAMARDLDAILQAERFSNEDFARFMSEIFPPESRVDPANAPTWQAERVPMTNTSLSVAQPSDEPSMMVSGSDRFDRADRSGSAAAASIAQPARRFPVIAIVAAAVVIVAAIGGYVLTRSGPAASVATAAKTTDGTPPPTPPPPAAAAAMTPPVAEAKAALPAVRGVTDSEIVLGMATALSGSAKEYGRQIKVGIESAFQRVNEAGGVNGRKLRLVTVDDGYDQTRTLGAMKQLYDQYSVFGVMGNFGTATAEAALPFVLEHKMLFFGADTGATILRRDPPDRYVFNFRASYAEEAAAIIGYLVRVRRIRPDHIAVLTQEDKFGDTVYASLSKTLRTLRPDAAPLFRVGFQRNTVDVSDAVAQIRARTVPTEAVIMLAIARPAARFIEQLGPNNRSLQYIAGSWTDSASLAEELKMLGSRATSGVVLTQVVPSADSSATAVLDFKTAMAKYAPQERVDGTALEGYLMSNVLIEALQRTGRELNTERLVATLEAIRGFDLGIGAMISFGATEHQGSHKVWGMQLDSTGRYQQIDLE